MIAHPDDESFGLGAVLAALVAEDCKVSVLCFTHGEASTLGAAVDLGEIRAAELREAASELGIDEVHLLDYPDGGLSSVDAALLVHHIAEHLESVDLLVAFERGGVTGHPDHQAATRAAIEVATNRSLPLIEWGVPTDVAAALRNEFGVPFTTIDPTSYETIAVDRTRQHRAIARHASQATDNPVLIRRLALLGDTETIRITNIP